MFGILIIVVTIILIVLVLFVPSHATDNVALIIALISLGVTTYTMWIIIPHRIDSVQKTVDNIHDYHLSRTNTN